MFMVKVTHYKRPNSHGVLSETDTTHTEVSRGSTERAGSGRIETVEDGIRMWRLEFAAPENTVNPKEPIGRENVSGQGSPFRWKL